MTENLKVRPYQLMCIICKSAGGFDKTAGDRKLKKILNKIKKNPDCPVTIVCNVSGNYSYQNPGRENDTSAGRLSNVKRDLDILRLMGLVPGTTMPARALTEKLLNSVMTSSSICTGKKDSKIWKGCGKAESGNYEKARKKGLDAIIPARPVTERKKAKKISVKKMYDSKILSIRPHHLMCMACFSAGEKADAPIPEDNLYEAIDIVRKNPGIPVRLVEGPCMICSPCKAFLPEKNICTAGYSMSLRDEKKDLDVLYKLDMEYGMILPANELFNKLFSVIKSTKEICGFGDGVNRSEEWTSYCHLLTKEGLPAYDKARKEGMKIPGCGKKINDI
ncbi:MAG: hypothetical protein JW957_01635 [Candidatus Omnitrophica bacterium]|nr:hypothetical protein [Candidatus Omnitrophota bacterium]